VANHISAKFGEQILAAKQSSWMVQNFRIYVWQVATADTINQGWNKSWFLKKLKNPIFDLNWIF